MASKYKFTEDDLNSMIAAEVSGTPTKPGIKGLKSKFGIKDKVDVTQPAPITKPAPKAKPSVKGV